MAMLRMVVVLATILSAFAFRSSVIMRKNTRLQMSSESNSMKKFIASALLASTMVGAPVFAKEGAGANIGIFTNNAMSSPFVESEVREDPIFSPYSPYGNGEKAVYNGRKGSAEEIKFWSGKFKACNERMKNIPSYISKKTWIEVTGELTRSLYNYRESMNRLAASSSNPAAASAAAKTYFSDIEDIFVAAKQKNGAVAQASYDKSVKDLAAFSALLK